MSFNRYQHVLTKRIIIYSILTRWHLSPLHSNPPSSWIEFQFPHQSNSLAPSFDINTMLDGKFKEIFRHSNEKLHQLVHFKLYSTIPWHQSSASASASAVEVKRRGGKRRRKGLFYNFRWWIINIWGCFGYCHDVEFLYIKRPFNTGNCQSIVKKTE